MANFFNKQHNVLEIQLTNYGKIVYSRGDFNPEYYSFYDTDIIYDAEYAGKTEIQNDIVTRIKGAVSTKAAYKFQTIDSAENQADHIYKRPLGNSDLIKDKAPAWKISPVGDSQPITGSVNNSTPNIEYQGAGSDFTGNTSGSFIWHDQMIPLLNFEVEYTYGYDGDSLAEAQIVDIDEEEKILLLVEEENVLDKSLANFEIEVFVEKDKDASDFSKRWEQLQFVNRSLMSEGNLYSLLNETDSEIEDNIPPLTEDMVEYWLDLRVDDEIIERSKLEITQPDIYRRDVSPTGEVCD